MPDAGHLGLDAVEHRRHREIAVEVDRAAGVVVAGEREAMTLRGSLLLSSTATTGNAELRGLRDRDLLLVGVDHEQHVGQAAHVLDAAQRALELVALAGQVAAAPSW